MATVVSYNGSNFSIPANREPRGWGTSLTSFLLEVAEASFTPAGGNYRLQADLNLGSDGVTPSSYGLVALYYKSVTANIAQSGQLRLARADTIAWRNQANGADLALGVDTGNRLEFNSVDLVTVSSTDTLTNKTIDGASNTITNVSLSTGVTGTLPVANGGTGVTSSTGSGSVVLSTSPTLTTPNLGTPSAATLTNATGLPVSTGISGLGSGVATFLATPSSANLRDALTDETGSGAAVFGTSPTIATPSISAPVITSGATIRGDLLLQNTSGSQPTLQLSEDPDNGTNKIIIQAPANLSADYTLTLPSDDGSANQVLQTDGNGGLSWTSPLTNPMNTAGDIIIGGSSGAATRLGIGSTGQILSVVSGSPAWQTGVTGRTDGAAVSAGMVGETQTASMSNTTLTGTTVETDVTGASITLGAGVWLVSYSVSLGLSVAASVGGESTLSLYLTNSSNVKVSGLDRSIAIRSVSTNSNLIIAPVSASTVLNISSSTTYKLRGQISNASGTAVSGVIYTSTSQFQGNFFAVRIA